MPLVCGSVSLGGGDVSLVQLPVISISHHENGRVVCLGSIELLTLCNSEVAEYFAFIERLFDFVTNHSRTPYGVLILGFATSDAGRLHQNLDSLGIDVIQSDTVVSLAKFKVVITASSCRFGDELARYVNSGGGLICCADNPLSLHAQQMNMCLMHFGLAFSPFQMMTPETRRDCMRLNATPNELLQCRLPWFEDEYQRLLGYDTPDLEELDILVQALRFHLHPFQRVDCCFFDTTYDYSWDYLNRTTYQQPEGLCHGSAQQLVSILLCDIIARQDPARFKEEHHLASIFPGIFCPDDLESGTLVAEYAPGVLQSTGLWLPAGIVSEVTCSRRSVEGFVIQIGVHSENLLETPAPWKRWPVVTQTFSVVSFPMRIGSPFGGLVYFKHNQSVRFHGRSIQFRFSNVVRAPFYTNAESWPALRGLGPPWTEIETKFTTFTVPSEFCREVRDFHYVVRLFDALTTELFVFLSAPNRQPKRFRVVFDIDLPKGGSVCSYPLVMSYDAIAGVLFGRGPTTDLFAIFMMLGICSLPETNLEPAIEAALGALVAAHLFLKTWPKASPLDFTFGRLSPVFFELWTIYQRHDKKLIPWALSRFYEVAPRLTSEESARFIANELAIAADRDFSSLLEKMLNTAPSLQKQFPEYKLEEDE
jgi:hypothetical protein